MHLIEIAGEAVAGAAATALRAMPTVRRVSSRPTASSRGLAVPGLEGAGSASRSTKGIGLVAAAVSDHSQIDLIATELHAMGTRLHVSSMRTDPLSLPLLEALAAGGAQTLTIAPEAGTDRLRRVINKTQGEDSLLAADEGTEP